MKKLFKEFFWLGMIILMAWLFIITFSCKGVKPITDEHAPNCCKIMFITLYLIQESKAVNVDSLLNCCRIEEKINFCNEQKSFDKNTCLDLMKTF